MTIASRHEKAPFFNQYTCWGAMEKVITKSGQEPNGIKLSSNTPLINKLRASHGDQVAVSRIGSALNGAG
jgi:hypothetical protein